MIVEIAVACGVIAIALHALRQRDDFVKPDPRSVLDAIERAEGDACSAAVSGARVETAADRARRRASRER